MTPDLAAVIADVRDELGELLERMDRDGGTYAARYAEWVIEGPARIQGPPAPSSLAGMPGKLIREIVMDHAAARHAVPARLR